jgi:hypothetical protein
MPLPKARKPTVQDILELFDETKKRYEESGIYSQWEEDELFYELDFRDRLALPEEFRTEGIILPTARDLVDTSVDNTDLFNIRVWVGKKGESQKSHEEMNLLRKFGLGVLYRNSIESSLSPLRVGGKHYWLYGLAIFKTVWDADRWANRPQRKEGESDDEFAARIDEWRAGHQDSIPIVIQAVNPRNVLLDPYYEGGMFVFEVREELCFNVKQMFPNWTNPRGRKVTDKVEHISFWTKDYRCELYDREPILKVPGGVAKHSYGFIPYVAIDTGLGNVSADNDLTKRYVGVLRYVRDLLVSESRDYSIGDVILKRTAFPWGYLKGPNAQSVQQIFQRFGEYNALPDGVDIVDMAPKVPPDALLSWLGVAADYLSAHAAPRSVRGLGESGVRSGADRRLILAQAATRYQYSNEAFKHGIAKVLSNCARIMKHVVPGDINVWARTPTDEFDIEIKKEKMKEPFTFYVEFAPISEEDEYRRHDDQERLYKSGIVTKQWVRRQMSNVDPEAMEIEEEVERLKADPQVQQLISQYVMSKLLEALTKKSTAESIENPPPVVPPVAPGAAAPGPAQPQTTEPGRRVVPPIPNVPPIGSAEELQNRLRQLRSQVPMTDQGRGGGGNRR